MYINYILNELKVDESNDKLDFETDLEDNNSLIVFHGFFEELLSSVELEGDDFLDFISDYGLVVSLSDGIVGIEGLLSVANGEMISIITGSGEIKGLVLNLEHDKVKSVVFGNDFDIQPVI